MNLSEKNKFIKITKNIILSTYEQQFLCNYKRKYSIEYYLNIMFELINNINNWNTINKLIDYKPIFKYDKTIPKYHWKTIQNQFIKWSSDGIFKKAFDSFINIKNEQKNEIDLYIDTTFIHNKYGVEGIAMNTDNKKKKAGKISLICDNDNFIYSISSIPINIIKPKRKYKKRRKNNNKRRKRKYIKSKSLIKKNKTKGFIHDVNTIQFSINNINKEYKFNITLIGDKGYITKNEYKFNKKKIILLTSKRNNQKKIKDNKLFVRLCKRRLVENTIAKIKKNERILVRKDHKLHTYMSWVYICSLLHNLRVVNKINK